jgi:hypothetical protein
MRPRKVVVSSKFDNRLKEFSERWEVDRYLSATGYLSSNVKPFFVALPKERTITTSADFRNQIQQVCGFCAMLPFQRPPASSLYSS